MDITKELLNALGFVEDKTHDVWTISDDFKLIGNFTPNVNILATKNFTVSGTCEVRSLEVLETCTVGNLEVSETLIAEKIYCKNLKAKNIIVQKELKVTNSFETQTLKSKHYRCGCGLKCNSLIIF